MKSCSVSRFYLVAFCCSLIVAGGCGSSSNQASSDTELLSVVAISRHGIRSPTSSVDTLNQYTTQPQGFPQWPAPADVAGNLSTYGQENVTRLGSWYRDFYVAQGLLPPRGTCPGDGAVFIYADVFERTIHTAQGYLDGMFLSEATPDCRIQVLHSSNLRAPDPYIDTAASGKCDIKTDVARPHFMPG